MPRCQHLGILLLLFFQTSARETYFGLIPAAHFSVTAYLLIWQIYVVAVFGRFLLAVSIYLVPCAWTDKVGIFLHVDDILTTDECYQYALAVKLYHANLACVVVHNNKPEVCFAVLKVFAAILWRCIVSQRVDSAACLPCFRKSCIKCAGYYSVNCLWTGRSARLGRL